MWRAAWIVLVALCCGCVAGADIEANDLDQESSERLESELVGDVELDLVAEPAAPAAESPESDVAMCAAAITVAITSVALPALKLRKFVASVGGVRTAAKLLVGATTFTEKAEVIIAAIGGGAAEILGIREIRDSC